MKTHPASRSVSRKKKDTAARRAPAKQENRAPSPEEDHSRLLTLFENSHDGIAYLDTSGIILDVNPAAVRIFGGTKEELVGREFSALPIFQQKDKPVILDDFRRILAGETASIELYITDKKGEQHFLRSSTTLLKSKGKVFGVMAIVQDATSEKLADEAIQLISLRQEAILASVPDIVMEVDNNKVYTWANKAGYRFFGEEVVGKEAAFYFEGEQKTYNHVQPLFNGDESVIYVESLQRRIDGEKRLLAWWCRVLKDKHGNVTGALSTARDITEQRHAEDALRESEATLKSILQAAPVGIGIVKNRIISWTNDTLRAMTGYTAEELAGKSSKILYPTDEEFYYVGEEKYRQIREYGSGTVETRWKKKDGAIMDILLSSVPINPADLSQGVTFTALDITERKRQAELLRIQRDLSIAFGTIRDEKTLLDKLLETALHIEGVDCGGVYLRDPETSCIDLLSHRGLSAEFIQSASHFNPEAPQTVLIMKGAPVYASHQKLGVPINGIREKEGLRAIALLPLKYENQVIGALNIASHTQDEISEEQKNILETLAGMVGGTIARVSAESALRVKQQNLQVLFNTIDDFMFIIDKGLRFLEVNPAVIERIGYGREQLSLMSAVDLHPKERRKEAERVMTDILAGTTALCTIPIETKAGKLIPVETKVIKGTWDDKEVLFAISRDISSRIKLEEQLRQSEKMEAIGQLAGGIAHDFNNQLSGIMGYADLIREDVGDNQHLSRYADNIIISTRRAADLTSQLLAFARKGKILSMPVNIHKLIVEVVALLQRSIDKRIEIKQQLNANPPMTRGDPTQLQNAILNLAINARDAMPNGGELILSTDTIELDEVYTRKNLAFEVTPGRYLQICVTDTGIGMDEETKKHVFEPFFTTKEIGKGTGMGLPAVYGTVKSHKGSISFYTEPGRGTIFKLFLPLYLEDIEIDAESLIQGVYIKGSAKILLVDDEELVRSVAKDMLEGMGYKVITSSNGRKAMDTYIKEWKNIDLVILDMIMPEKDGKETFLAMKEVNPGIVALLSSGYSIDSKIEQLLEFGVKGFIQKPYRSTDLSKKVADVLNK